MKIRFLFLFIVFMLQIALADNIPIAPLPMSIVLQNLQAKNYSKIKSVEFENGSYKINAIHSGKKRVTVFLNPKHLDAQIKNTVTPKEDGAPLSLLQAAQNVETTGYHNIYKIMMEKNSFLVYAQYQDGKRALLKVDAATGNIIQLE